MRDEPVFAAETSEPEAGIDLVVFTGDLDFASGEQASAALAALSGEARRVVVDLSGVGFVDSSGVKMLVAAARAVEGEGGTFAVCAASAPVRRVIDILHLDQVVRLVETRAEAIAAVRVS